MDKLDLEEKKKPVARNSGKVPKKKTNQGKRGASLVTPAAVKPVEEPSEGKQAKDTNEPSDEAMIAEDSVLDAENVPEGEQEDFGANSLAKKLKTEDVPVPSSCYIIQAVMEKLQGDLNVAYFKNPGSDGKEPYMPLFKNTFLDNVKDELLVDGIGARCDGTHQFVINKKFITDASAMKYGWSMFINESVFHPGAWGVHLCNMLSESEAYKSSFDPQRTNGRPPHFEVSHVVYPSPSYRRKLDEVMMDEGIAKYLCKKYNLKNYGVRRRLKTSKDWEKLLQPYFADPKRGQTVIEKFLADQAGLNY